MRAHLCARPCDRGDEHHQGGTSWARVGEEEVLLQHALHRTDGQLEQRKQHTKDAQKATEDGIWHASSHQREDDGKGRAEEEPHAADEADQLRHLGGAGNEPLICPQPLADLGASI